MAEKQKNRKQDRCRKSPQNLRYMNEGRHNKSHVRRIEKHIARFPADVIAANALKVYRIKAGIVRAK